MNDAWFYLTLGITLGFAAAVQPGPLLTYIISQTLKNGWRSTLPAAFAPLVSDIPIATVILMVLSQVPAWLVQALRLAGGFFLLYLAYGAFKAWQNFAEYKPAAVQSGGQSLLKAATVNWLNPGPVPGLEPDPGSVIPEGVARDASEWDRNPGGFLCQHGSQHDRCDYSIFICPQPGRQDQPGDDRSDGNRAGGFWGVPDLVGSVCLMVEVNKDERG